MSLVEIPGVPPISTVSGSRHPDLSIESFELWDTRFALETTPDYHDRVFSPERIETIVNEAAQRDIAERSLFQRRWRKDVGLQPKLVGRMGLEGALQQLQPLIVEGRFNLL